MYVSYIRLAANEWGIKLKVNRSALSSVTRPNVSENGRY
jgi:hypothetical protein